MRFEKLRGKKKSVHVAEQIIKSARSGDIKPGDKLPSESELAEQTGVSRPSVREALAALRLTEIVKTRAGNGTYFMGLKDEENIRTRLLNTLEKNRHPLQLQEARAAFECGIIKSAVEKFNDEDRCSLEEILDQMTSAAEDEDYETFIEYHKKFHLAIAQATKNVVIEETVAGFKNIMDQRIWKDLERLYYLPEKKEYLEESVSIHSQIFKALKEKDSDGATFLMRRHFERYS